MKNVLNKVSTFLGQHQLLTAREGVTIEDPAITTFISGEEIRLQPGFTALQGAEFWAYIDPTLNK